MFQITILYLSSAVLTVIRYATSIGITEAWRRGAAGGKRKRERRKEERQRETRGNAMIFYNSATYQSAQFPRVHHIPELVRAESIRQGMEKLSGTGCRSWTKCYDPTARAAFVLNARSPLLVPPRQNPRSRALRE